MATIEFTPDRESNFANEVFLPIHQKNNYPVGNNKRNSDKETTDEKIFSYLRKLVAEAESDAKDSKYDVFPDKNVSSSQRKL
jgi:hypothetical protein